MRRRFPSLMRRPGTRWASSTAAVTEVVGMSGFAPAGGGSYLQRDDSGGSHQVGDERTVLLGIRVDAIPTSIIRLASKDDGNPGHSVSIVQTPYDRLQYKDSGVGAFGLALDANDVNKTILVAIRRSTAQDFADMHAYNVAHNSLRYVAGDSSVSSPTTSSQSFALGAQRGDDVGGNEAEDITILYYGISSTVLTVDQLDTLFQACAAAGDIATGSFPGVFHAHTASTEHADSLARDIIGTSHLEVVEGTTPLTLSTFEPEYRNDGAFNLVLGLGQSEVEGRVLLSEVPTTPIDYTQDYTGAQLFIEGENEWDDVFPRGDNDWGPLVSMLRALGEGGVENLWAFQRGTGGTDLANDWNASGGSELEAAIDRLRNGTTQTPHILPIFADVRLMIFYWDHGQADAQVESEANAYETNFDALIDYLLALKGLWKPHSSFRVVAPKLSDYLSFTYVSTVNTAFDDVATDRDDVLLVDTDNLVDKGDGVHRNPQSIINAGVACGSAYLTDSNTTAAAP